jgi:general secretion pathway protein F
MQYAIKALRRLEPSTLIVDAVDVADARRQAEAQGYAVVTVNAKGGLFKFNWKTRTEFPLLNFNQSLLTLLKAGLSLVEAIEALAEREARADIKQVLRRMQEQLYEGLTLSAALERQPEVFPPLYVATVRANEKTGALIEAIERFIAYRAQVDVVRKRIIGAAVYPALILGVGALVILFLMLYVVPRFSQVFEDLGNNIPAMSRLLLQWGKFVHQNGWTVLMAGLALIAASLYALSQKPVQARIGVAITRIPRIGEYVRVYQLARFYRSLGMLLRAGIPIITALDMVVGLLPPAMRTSLEQARRDVKEGQPISAAFEQHHLTTAVSLRMLRVGERTGQMGEMMDRIAVFYDEDIAQAIDWFIRLFEPLLMIVIGMVIGAVVLLMYAPIFELAGSIQ